MSEPSQTPAKSNKSTLLVIAGAAVIAAGVGAYFAFFQGGGGAAPEMAAITQEPLVGNGGGAVDLQAYFDTKVPAEAKANMTYEISGDTLTNLVAKNPDGSVGATAKSIQVKALDTAHEPPQFVDVRVDDLVITPPAGELPAGMTEVKMDVVYAYSYDPAAKTFDLKVIDVDAEDLGRISLGASFTDVAAMGGDPENMMNDLAGAKLKALSLVLNSKTFLKLALEQTAAQQGTDLAGLKTQGTAMLSMVEAQLTDDIAKQAISALRVMLDKVENVTLTITANPAEPFALANLMNIGMTEAGMPDLAALEPLNLKIEAE